MSETISKAGGVTGFLSKAGASGDIGLNLTGLGVENYRNKKKEKAEARAADEERQNKESQQRVLIEREQEDERKATRAYLLSRSTTGYGANTNLARSFLTTL